MLYLLEAGKRTFRPFASICIGKTIFQFVFFFLSHTWLSLHDKQIQSLEESAESLRERCLKFYKGCHKYTYVQIYIVFTFSIVPELSPCKQFRFT